MRGLAAKGSKLFAIRDGVLELLDVARTVYKDTREDIVLSKSLLFPCLRQWLSRSQVSGRGPAHLIAETHDLDCEAIYTKAGFRFRVAHEKDAPRLSSHFINQDRYKNRLAVIAPRRFDVTNNRTLFATHELESSA